MPLEITEITVPPVNVTEEPAKVEAPEAEQPASAASRPDIRESEAKNISSSNDLLPDGEDGPEKVITSFTGSIPVKFPETGVEFLFLPLETTRGKLEARWKYPSPIPGLSGVSGVQNKIDKYAELLSPDGVIDLIEDSLNRTCQAKWRQAVEGAGKDKPISEIARIFAEIFYEGKSREASTKEGFLKKSATFQKMALEEKARSGGKVTDKVREYSKLARENALKAQEMLMREIEEMEAGGGK
jgi:hypothetical protein